MSFYIVIREYGLKFLPCIIENSVKTYDSSAMHLINLALLLTMSYFPASLPSVLSSVYLHVVGEVSCAFWLLLFKRVLLLKSRIKLWK